MTPFPAMGRFTNETWRLWRPEGGSSQTSASVTLVTLPSGKQLNRESRGGIAPGVMDVLAGILSVLLWQWKCWVNRSISMAVVPILSFHTMITRSPRVRASLANHLHTIGAI